MRSTDYALNCGRWLPFLAVCILSGCAGGTHQQKSPWPWEYDRQDGRYPTGDYVTVSGPVASFGDAPKAAKPVAPEALEPPAPNPTPPYGPVAKAPPPPVSTAFKPALGAVAGRVKRDYDFTVAETKIGQPSYVPTGAVREAYDITAANRGNAPVSVTIGGDPASSLNMTTDKPLPVTAVVPAHTEQVLVRVSAREKNKTYRFGYTCSWSIGDHAARHHCPEHYRFPFGDTVRAFAGVSDPADSTPFTHYAVVFSLPADTPVLAARKGMVVRISAHDDKIDILHDDGTIASYAHLGTIGEGIVEGKAVVAGDAIGTAGATDNREVAFFQLTVWRPESRPGTSLTSNGQGPGYDLVSFPLEFCIADSGECGVLTRSQWVARGKAADVKKQGNRGPRSAGRKSGGS